MKVEWLVFACSSDTMNCDSINFISKGWNQYPKLDILPTMISHYFYLKARPASLDGCPKAWNRIVSVRCLRDAKYDSIGLVTCLRASLSCRVNETWAVYFATVTTVLIRSRLGNWPFAPSGKPYLLTHSVSYRMCLLHSTTDRNRLPKFRIPWYLENPCWVPLV
jgi:hypothetical protein